MAKVLITGGSGSIGRKLIEKLKTNGHEVSVIGRSSHDGLGVPSFTWDLEKGTMNETALRNVTHIIHLAGAGIADRPWSPNRKKEILESRVKPLQLLSAVLERRNQRIKAIISSSAIGYYGAVTTDRIFKEEDPAANDFLGITCKMWEDAVKLFGLVADREVRVRTGVVLMNEGGALPKLVRPVRFGFGAAVGSGNQWMPWIHIDDLTELYLRAVEDEVLQGPYNAVAPEQVTQSVFIKTAGKVLKRPILLPTIPAFLLKSLIGEMSQVVTEGSRVSSQRLMDTGFQFKHLQLNQALNDLLK